VVVDEVVGSIGDREDAGHGIAWAHDP
jgi:hypothetical protein